MPPKRKNKDNEESIQELHKLPEWDVQTCYKPDGFFLLLGERGKGKTTMAEYISQLDKYFQKSIVIVMAGSEKVKLHWIKRLGKVFVMLPDIRLLQSILTTQDIHIKNYAEKGTPFPDHLRLTVILDDICLDSEIMNHPIFKKTVNISRQKYVRFVCLAQNITQIHKRNRRAFDACGVCGLQNRESLIELHELYGTFVDKEEFIAQGMLYTQRLGQMFIIDKDNTQLCQLNAPWPLLELPLGLPHQATYNEQTLILKQFKQMKERWEQKMRERQKKKNNKRTTDVGGAGGDNQKYPQFTNNGWKNFYQSQKGKTYVLTAQKANDCKNGNNQPAPIQPFVNMLIGRKNWLHAIQTNITFHPSMNPFIYNVYQFTIEHEQQEYEEQLKNHEKELLFQQLREFDRLEKEKRKQEKIQQEKAIFLSQTEEPNINQPGVGIEKTCTLPTATKNFIENVIRDSNNENENEDDEEDKTTSEEYDEEDE